MTTSAWIYWISGAALGGLGFYLASWALLSDWLAGRRKLRRCAKCWYDMSAVVGLKCPECGREAGSEERLLQVLAVFRGLRYVWHPGRLPAEGWKWAFTRSSSSLQCSARLPPRVRLWSC
jgi:hypothetical protein